MTGYELKNYFTCKCILHIMLICHYCLIQVSEYPKESMDGLDATPGPASAGATVLSEDEDEDEDSDGGEEDGDINL